MHDWQSSGPSPAIVVVNYGMGNLGSIANMLKKIGLTPIVTSDADQIARADGLILPGVGAFDRGMKNLHDLGLVEALERAVLGNCKPILGLCLGMQLFTKGSDEGRRPGLGWLDAQTVRFKFDDRDTTTHKIPHIGWNLVCPTKESAVFRMRDGQRPRFYFAHSYHVAANDRSDVLAEAEYGYRFVAAVQRGNITGVQFHPEKSHRFGFDLLSNFVAAASRTAANRS